MVYTKYFSGFTKETSQPKIGGERNVSAQWQSSFSKEMAQSFKTKPLIKI